jgi:phage gpG-like protein
MIKVTVEGKKLSDILKENRAKIYKFIIANIQENRGELFDRSGAMPGHKPWAPLWELSRRAGDKPLLDRGTLRKSLGPGSPGGYAVVQGGKIIVGTTLKYAALMNFGTTKMPDGKLKAKRAQALKIPVAKEVDAPLKVTKNSIEKRLKNLQAQLNEAKTKGAKRTLSRQVARLKMQIQNRTYKTGKFIFRKWVRIPERRFDIWTKEDNEELMEAVKIELSRILNGKN